MEFLGNSAVHKRYMAEKIYRTSQTSAEQVATLATLPLIAHPGTAWDYSRSTDVLGRVLEVASGQTLGEHLHDVVFSPLGMEDTGFWVPEAKQARIAEPFAHDPLTGEAQRLLNIRQQPSYESGGGGLCSTAQDYFRFASMLAHGGTLNGVHIIGRKTLDFMRANHLTPDMPIRSDLLPTGTWLWPRLRCAHTSGPCSLCRVHRRIFLAGDCRDHLLDRPGGGHRGHCPHSGTGAA